MWTESNVATGDTRAGIWGGNTRADIAICPQHITAVSLSCFLCGWREQKEMSKNIPPTLSASSAKKCCTDRDPHAAWWRYPTMQCSDLYTMTPCFWYCSIEKTCLQLLLHPPNHLQYCWLLTLHAADYNCWRCDSLLVLGDNKICRDDNQHHSLFYLCRIFLFCTKF